MLMKILDLLKEKFDNNNLITTLTIIVVLGAIILIATSSFVGETDKKSVPETVLYQESSSVKSNSKIIEDYASTIERKLEDILSSIDGVGKVKVMVTLEDTAERIPAINTTRTEEKTSEKDSKGGIREVFKQNYSEQIVVNNSDDDSLVIIKEVKPKVKGVIVVAEGADDLYIKEKLYEAVKTVLGISGNRVGIFSSKPLK
ncbi:sporulation stage III protein AG [Caloranaerobacter azorensis]|uniref:Sporulation stage III protein AG n=2 Tax=Caloranaerobacter azorensis TaxID=116090 RepID=A0A6P1YH44_9FIRM|nr:sporulation stage III protein AG [Caloranaerobacter azorensis]